MTNTLLLPAIVLAPATIGGRPIQFDKTDLSEQLREELISMLVNHLLALHHHKLSL
jgi:hypothetical protein